MKLTGLHLRPRVQDPQHCQNLSRLEMFANRLAGACCAIAVRRLCALLLLRPKVPARKLVPRYKT